MCRMKNDYREFSSPMHTASWYIELGCHFRSRSILNWLAMLTLLWLSLAIYTLLSERPKAKERSIQLLKFNFIYVWSHLYHRNKKMTYWDLNIIIKLCYFYLWAYCCCDHIWVCYCCQHAVFFSISEITSCSIYVILHRMLLLWSCLKEHDIFVIYLAPCEFLPIME
jgi:hypothetical protein